MHDVAALLAAAAAAFALARALRMPAIPLLLIAGIVIARLAQPGAEGIESALLLGVTFLVFVAGIELDPRRIRRERGVALRVGGLHFVAFGVVGLGAAEAFGYGLVESSYIALALTASSTLVCVRMLQQRGVMYEPFGRLVLGVLLLQDALVLLSIPLITELADGVLHALASLVAIALLGALALIIRARVAPLLLRIANDQELLLLSAMSTLFGFIALAGLLELPIVVGAFLAGVSLSRFPVDGVVRADFAPIADFFTAIFFTALGALVGIPGPRELLEALVLAALVVLITPPLVAWLAARSGFGTKAAIESGLLLSQTSEISLVIGLAGMIEGVIDGRTFTIIALVTLTTMLLTPLLANDTVASFLTHRLARRRRASVAPVPRDHVLLLGAGATGMPLLEDLVLAGTNVVVVEDDPGVVKRLREAGVDAVTGDASTPEVLRRAGADNARVVVSTIRRPRDNETLLGIARGVPVLVRVFDQADADWVRARGGVPVIYSLASADNLMDWFDDAADELDERLAARVMRAESAT